MDVSSIAALATDLSTDRTQQLAQVAVARKQRDTQQSAAAQLVALIANSPRPRFEGEAGSVVDLYA